MGKNKNPKNSSPPKGSPTEPSQVSVGDVVKKILAPLASLKLTVALFAMSIFIVLAGTFAQTDKGIWQVVHDYFRIQFSSDHVFTSAFAWIDIKIFFPPSFFPDLKVPERITFSNGKSIPFGFPFPKGWLIGFVMAINLVAAHAVRFKIQTRGLRLYTGLGVIALGILVTWMVIVSGDNKEGMQQDFLIQWSTLWIGMKGGLLCLWAAVVFGIFRLESHRKIDRWILISVAIILGILIGWLFTTGSDATLSGPSMRILWQLIKGTFAGLVLLAGCILAFKKRAGIVLLHSGIGLMMFSELLVGTQAIEEQMSIAENESRNYAEDSRSLELTIVDLKKKTTVVVPASILRSGEVVQHEDLPFDIKLETYYVNSTIHPAQSVDENPATRGTGLKWIAKEEKQIPATESNAQDWPAAYVTFLKKNTDSEDLGTYLVSLLVFYSGGPEKLELDGTKYDVVLRYKRTYKPHTIHLVDVRQVQYKGTTTPMKYESYVYFVHPDGHVSRKIRIWMNNPLRFAGETFYQSSYRVDPQTGIETTGLQIVSNTGWMIPYVSCMIVATGMLSQFLITLLRFLKRQSTPPSVNSTVKQTEKTPKDAQGTNVAKTSPKRKQQSNWARRAVPWVVVLGCACYLGSKAIPPSVSEEEPKIHDFGKIPVKHNGRLKPLDTVARSSLRRLSNRQDFLDEDKNRQPAIRWLLDVMAKPEAAEKHKVFKILNPDVLSILELDKLDPPVKNHLYSFDQFKGRLATLYEQAGKAHKKEKNDREPHERKMLELIEKLNIYSMLLNSFQENYFPFDSFRQKKFDASSSLGKKDILLELMRRKTRKSLVLGVLAVPPRTLSGNWESYVRARGPEIVQEMAREQNLVLVKDLAREIAKDIPDELVSRTIERIRSFAEQVLAQTKEGDVSEELRASFDRNLPGFADDDRLRAMYRELLAVFAESDKDTSTEQIFLSLSSENQRTLTNFEVLQFFQTFIGNLPEHIRQAAVEEIDQSGPVQSDRIQRYLEVLLGQLIQDIVQIERLDGEVNPSTHSLSILLANYREGDAHQFNEALESYHESLNELSKKYDEQFLEFEESSEEEREKLSKKELDQLSAGPVDLSKINFESFFNHCEPFFYSAVLYLFAFIFTMLAMLGWTVPMRRSAFWLIIFTLVVHTAALIARIYISGRPPVTTLYSSAIFIGWGCVVLGLIIEMIFRLGIGNVVASINGFAGLLIAHLLTTMVPDHKGDTIIKMQAVLDSQFWLATHVTCVTLGYATTFLAGALGVVYILRGMLSPTLTQKVGKALSRMIYGTLCFAVFFSFVGTVLGGLWADDSWGRFWGWDPKENGALIIVLWNVLILHARWGAMVKDRGLAVLAVLGNITTLWSWFGVNELGVGLHSYGFTEGVLMALLMIVGAHLLIAAIGLMPLSMWWSLGQDQPVSKRDARNQQRPRK